MNVTITVGNNKYELRKIVVGEWLELSKIYDGLTETDKTDAGYVESRCRVIQIGLGLTQEEINNLPVEDMLPLYLKVTEEVRNMVVSRLNEKKSEEEKPLIEG